MNCRHYNYRIWYGIYFTNCFFQMSFEIDTFLRSTGKIKHAKKRTTFSLFAKWDSSFFVHWLDKMLVVDMFHTERRKCHMKERERRTTFIWVGISWHIAMFPWNVLYYTSQFQARNIYQTGKRNGQVHLRFRSYFDINLKSIRGERILLEKWPSFQETTQ